MPHIHPCPSRPKTEESFEPFGELWHAKKKPSDRRILSPTSYSHDGRSTVHVIWQPEGGLRFDQLERHFGVTQSFVQLSGAQRWSVLHRRPILMILTIFHAGRRACVPDRPWRGILVQARHLAFPEPAHTGSQRATFLILNSDPNPTQMVNYQTGTGFLSKDLDVGPDPKVLEYSHPCGIEFEIEA
ncbi:MAG: hypothetical protein Ct9H300mP16_09400 [Pseudomonadota bacterium]|nr:MAG: hypothetical protein Ct9H300mP16_09400 [Pseudomonadota bacterium]